MRYLNKSALEKLKNGTIFSTMHTPKMKKSDFKPSIVILGNECVDDTWTSDRLTASTTNRKDYAYIPISAETLRKQLNPVGDFITTSY